MSVEQNEIDVFESRRFEKALNKLFENQLKVVEDEIDQIIDPPEIGELKKGDLSYLRVHKFKMDNQLVLLGYYWVKDKIDFTFYTLDRMKFLSKDERSKKGRSKVDKISS